VLARDSSLEVDDDLAERDWRLNRSVRDVVLRNDDVDVTSGSLPDEIAGASSFL
jgi:hypothetical protein